VMFRAESMSQALLMYKAMFGADTIRLSIDIALGINSLQKITLVVAILIVVFQGMRTRRFSFGRILLYRHSATFLLAAQFPFFLLSISKLIASNYSPFLYFQF